ncbi:MAG TPA: hypothetical protein VLS27_03845 [Gammaproteobacteria bacterium]|nr:hypothetical protein [Gammaproteobacteria bacterium]
MRYFSEFGPLFFGWRCVHKSLAANMLLCPSGRLGIKIYPEGFIVMDSVSGRQPLPKNWPKGIKSAVLHVIALARVVVVQTRRLVASGPDLKSALDEIALLQEEI